MSHKRKHRRKHTKKSSNNVPVIIAIVVLSLFLAAIGFWFAKNAGDNSEPPVSDSSDTASDTVSDSVSESSDDSSESSSDSSSQDDDVFVIEPSNFKVDGVRIRYTGGNTTAAYGIDVSKYQGEIDWAKVAADDVQFAMIRAGIRGYVKPNLVEDPTCRTNIEGATDAGLDVGLYFFSQAITTEEAVEEANFLADIADEYGITYPLVVDWERTTTDDSRTKDISGSDATAFVKAFCDEIEKRGYTAAFYFNPTDSAAELDTDALSDYIFWMAEYGTTVPDLDYDFKIWQYSNTGSVDGIDGAVDLNICFYDFSAKEGELND